MPGDVIREPQVDFEDFDAFRDKRPKEEKWELIAGPLSRSHPEWVADREIDLKLPRDRKFNPEPDVTAIDQIYATPFYFVAEVLSEPSSGMAATAADAGPSARLPRYCRAVLFVEQGRVAAELHVRGKRWRRIEMTGEAERVDTPDLGDIGPLDALYRDTPLFPGKRRRSDRSL